MAVHTELSPAEAADRLALRELFDAYAHCADRRDAEGQKALFTDDTIFAVYIDRAPKVNVCACSRRASRSESPHSAEPLRQRSPASGCSQESFLESSGSTALSRRAW
jgi:SnoaL-like protein